MIFSELSNNSLFLIPEVCKLAKCIMCGKQFDVDEKKDPYEDEYDDVPKKPPAFCQMCEAKLKYESDKSQKIPKPM